MIASNYDTDWNKREAKGPTDEERFWGISDERWIAILTAGLTAATFVLGAFTYKLWRSTAQAIKDGAAGIQASQRSAKAAEDAISSNEAALEHARASAERQLRAYIMIDTFVIQGIFHGGVPSSIVTFKNAGQTPAHKVQIRGNIAIDDFPLKEPLPAHDFSDFRTSKEVLGPGMSRSKTDSLKVQISTIPHIQGLRSGDFAVYAFGEIRYEDVFGRPHVTKYRLLAGGATRILDHLFPDSEGNEAD